MAARSAVAPEDRIGWASVDAAAWDGRWRTGVGPVRVPGLAAASGQVREVCQASFPPSLGLAKAHLFHWSN